MISLIPCFCALTAEPGPQGEETGPDQPQARWREGPVRYIIASEEDKRFKQLATDEDRARFIEIFWARRDPDPRTLINEYRYEFWKRVATANRFFADSTKPGWKTDMGRYYIILGPPDDRDTSREMPLGLGRRGVRGAITWRYSHSPLPKIGTGLTIVFTRDATGEYRVESDPTVVQEVLNNPLGSVGPDLTAFGMSLLHLAPRLTELQLMMDLGRLDEVPSQEDLLTTIITAEEFFGVIPFSARYDFFAGLPGSTIVAVTLSLHPDPLDPDRRPLPPDYLIVGRIEGVAGGPVVFLHEGGFSPSSHNLDPGYHGPYIYQAVTSLPPGGYRLSLAAFDRSTRKTGTYSDDVTVPPFSEDSLSLSSLCLSESIEPAPKETAQPAPYIIGHLKVTPRLIPSYHNGETFAVYYQVYSAVTDPMTHAPDLDIDYQFFVNQGGTLLPIGRPIHFDSVGNSAQGWSFPLRDWPAAEFMLQVTVTDAITGWTASRQVTFRVL